MPTIGDNINKTIQKLRQSYDRTTYNKIINSNFNTLNTEKVNRDELEQANGLNGVYYWNGESSDSNENNLALWQKIIDTVKTKTVMVYTTKYNAPEKRGIFLINPIDLNFEPNKDSESTTISINSLHEGPFSDITEFGHTTKCKYYKVDITLSNTDNSILVVSDIVSLESETAPYLSTYSNNDYINYKPISKMDPVTKEYSDMSSIFYWNGNTEESGRYLWQNAIRLSQEKEVMILYIGTDNNLYRFKLNPESNINIDGYAETTITSLQTVFIDIDDEGNNVTKVRQVIFTINANEGIESISNIQINDISTSNITVKHLNSNIINGSVTGSLRTIDSAVDDEYYTIGESASALGWGVKADGSYSHAEGKNTRSFGIASHAEGQSSYSSGDYSHAEGNNTIAYGYASHAEGLGTKAKYLQHVQGKYNIEDENNKYAHIVGNGVDYDNRSNAHTIDWEGNTWYKGIAKVGGTSYDDTDAKELATKEYVNGAYPVFYWNGKSDNIVPIQNAVNWVDSNMKPALIITYSDTTVTNLFRYKTIFIISPTEIAASATVNIYGYVCQGIGTEGANGVGYRTYRARVDITYDANKNVTAITNLGTYTADSQSFLPTSASASTMNKITFTPTHDYHPATKKYVDDQIGNISTLLDNINGEVV